MTLNRRHSHSPAVSSPCRQMPRAIRRSPAAPSPCSSVRSVMSLLPKPRCGWRRHSRPATTSSKAFEHYRTALDEPDALQPESHLAASLGLARCATALHHAPAAIHALESAAAVHGASADLEVALSAAYAAGGQHQRSLQAAQRASELAPGEASLRQLTQAAAQAGESGMALDAIRRLTSLQPSNPHVWLSVAELSGQADDLPSARQALATGDPIGPRRRLRLVPRLRPAVAAFSARLSPAGCAPRSLTLPLDPDLVRQMAEVSQHAGDDLTAQRAWVRLAELRHQDPEGLKLAARSLSLLGQRAVAIGIWQRAGLARSAGCRHAERPGTRDI